MRRLKTAFAAKFAGCSLAIFSGFQTYFALSAAPLPPAAADPQGSLLGWLATTQLLLGLQLACTFFSINFRDLGCHVCVLCLNCGLAALNLAAWLCGWPATALWAYGFALR